MSPIVTKDQLLPPECEGGYPTSQLEELMDTQQFKRLMLWMYGQTMMLCESKLYSHEDKTYHEACGGVAHGPVIYPWDLEGFLYASPILD